MGGYLLYSWYSSTGLFAPAAAATVAAPATVATTTPVVATPTPVAVTAPAVIPGGRFGPGLTSQNPWVMRPGGGAQRQNPTSLWSSTATYQSGDAVMFAAANGPATVYVNLTGANSTTPPPADTVNWAPIAWNSSR